MTDAALINWIFSCCFVYPIKQLSFYLTRFCWVNPWTPNRLLTWELTIKVWFLQHGFECSPSKRYKMAYTRGVQAVPERDLFKIWWGMQICTSTQKLSGWKWTCYCLLWFPQGKEGLLMTFRYLYVLWRCVHVNQFLLPFTNSVYNL